MGSSATTRAARPELCPVCVRRKPSPGHSTCRPCREQIRSASQRRYDERKAAGQCYRCGEPADGYLCESCSEARRAARRRA